MWVVIFKDGDALNCEALTVGPFVTHDEAYDALENLPAPRTGGHKFVEETFGKDSDAAHCVILAQRRRRDVEAQS